MGVAATIIIIFGQYILHGKIKVLSPPKNVTLTFQILDEPGAVNNIQKIFEERKINILNFKTKINKEPTVLDIKIVIRVSNSFNTTKLLCILQDNPIVKSVEY